MSSRDRPMGISRYTGQRMSPPAFCDISPLCQALTNSGQDIWISIQQKGARKTMMPTISTQDRPRAVRRAETKSIRTWTFFRKA